MARGDDCCYICNECPNSFTTLDELESHMAEDHLAKKVASSSQAKPCFIKDEFIDGEDESETKMDLVSDIFNYGPRILDFCINVISFPIFCPFLYFQRSMKSVIFFSKKGKHIDK